ncbi:NAD(P)-dependent dehydrogenase, short-chain alcohol dehydrogenase family [Acinetobacter marinus]|uniref:NAD(P)-dependent dehydrogenase, short-chain alcohol dehydrogenase family n=1 Tax=Acinetobacter marinus TaxID=281375 RepID=A0A1G6GI16_9GAMM|nr:SDR family oxidoreductase [Acinetobacter marinus]SDB81648.1 NAD(P)-dependent dehydrogenase, short-chain alcohol dehydrogenase family [Acinetobacter marinus]
MNQFDVSQKTVLITGASSGLGHHIAQLFVQEGANLVICARREDRLQALQTQLQAQFQVDIRYFVLDVNDRAAVQAMISHLESEGVHIDVLINNAGVSDSKRFLDYNDADWDKIVNTNLKAPWQCTQEVVQHMIRCNNAGAIINITSVLSESVNLGVSPYCASKAGLKHLTQVMAVELARYAIRVNAIAPGYMVTEINTDYLNSDAGQQLLKRIPLRKFVEFSDLNGPLLLLASAAGQGMTGVEIKVDGGHSCAPI